MSLTNRIVLITCFATALLMQCCNAPEPASFAQLHKGMSKQDVVKLLGEPSSQWKPLPARTGEPDPEWSLRWHYGDSLSTTASAVMGPDIAPDGVWVVVFNERDTVMDFRPPILPDDSFPLQKPPK